MDAWFARCYARLGSRYIEFICLGALAEAMFLMTPLSVAVAGRYEGLTFGQSMIDLAVADPILVLSGWIGVTYSKRELRVLRRWAAGDHDPSAAAEVAIAAHRLPRKLLTGTAVPAILVAQPIGVLTTMVQVHRVDIGTFLLLFFAGFFFALWGLVMLWGWMELSTRPILSQATRFNPNVTLRGGFHVSVTVKLMIALGSATLVSCCYVGAVSARPGSAFNGLLKLVSITAVVSTTFGGTLAALFSALLLGPIRDLSAGTRAVGAGDMQTRVAITSDDELGVLTASFNDMVEGLRERTQLRAHNQSLVGELQASRERIVTAGDAARRRVERDLHDGAQQQLVTARLKLGLLQRGIADRPESSALLAEVQADLDLALRELRDLAHGIYPAVLDDEGLVGALRHAVWRSGIPTELIAEEVTSQRPEVETAIYFCCVEALQNAAKHAGPHARATVKLHEFEGMLNFEVADDGVGFDVAGRRKSSGLQNISDRIGALGGTVLVMSEPGRGTRLCGSLPMSEEPESR